MTALGTTEARRSVGGRGWQTGCKFVAVLGEALKELIGPKGRFAAAAELVFGSDQTQSSGAVCSEERVAREVGFDAGRLAGLQAAFQVHMCQLDDQGARFDVVGFEVL